MHADGSQRIMFRNHNGRPASLAAAHLNDRFTADLSDKQHEFVEFQIRRTRNGVICLVRLAQSHRDFDVPRAIGRIVSISLRQCVEYATYRNQRCRVSARLGTAQENPQRPWSPAAQSGVLRHIPASPVAGELVERQPGQFHDRARPSTVPSKALGKIDAAVIA